MKTRRVSERNRKEEEGRGNHYQSLIMAVSVTILVLLIALHLIAFVLAVGAERRRSEVNQISLYSFFFISISATESAIEACSEFVCVLFRRKWFPINTTIEPTAFTPPTPPPSTASPPSYSCSSPKPSLTPLPDAFVAAKALSPVAPPPAPSSSSFSPGNFYSPISIYL